MDINIELYKVFFYIAKEGSITAAADKLFISQPAVTQSLKKLEEELGGPLFIRKKSGVVLTPEGQKLFEYIENSIYTLNNAKNLYSQYMNSNIGKVRVNTAGSWGILLMPEILDCFHKQYPNVEVSITVDRTCDAIKNILNSEIEIGLFEGNISEHKESLDLIEISKIKFNFYTSKKKKKKVGFIDVNHLENYDFLLPRETSNRMKMLKKKLDEKGISIHSNRFVAGTEMTKTMVEKGLGIGFFNEVNVKNNPNFIPVDLGIGPVEGVLTLAVKNRELISNATKHLLEIMEEVIRKRIKE